MELILTLILLVLCGICVLTKVLCMHGRQRGINDVGLQARSYQEAQRVLKAVLHEENLITAREQGLARNESRLLKDLGRIRHRLDKLRREDGRALKETPKKPTQVER